MGISLSALLTGASQARAGYSQGKQQAEQQSEKDGLQRALLMYKMKQEAESHRLAQALGNQKLNTKAAEPRDFVKEHQVNRDYDIAHPTPANPPQESLDTKLQKRIQELTTQGTPLDKANQQARAEFGQAPPATPQQSFSFPTVTSPDGQSVVARANNKTGELALTDVAGKAGGGAGQNSVRARTQALANASDALNAFEKSLDTIGSTVLPSVNHDALQTDYENLQLQMKEMYNLGVLNGPDLVLMRRIVQDPTSLRGRAMAHGSGDEQSRRIKAQIGQLREKLKGFQANMTQGAAAVGGGRGGQAVKPKGGGNTITVNGKTFTVPE